MSLSSAAKRTLSELLKALPHNGVGSEVARDTWHPDSGKFWRITKVVNKSKKKEHFDAHGYLFYHGRQISEEKRIASVWKWGWYDVKSKAAEAGAHAAPETTPSPSASVVESNPSSSVEGR